MRLRSTLHRAGARFRVHHVIRVDERRPVVADIAFTRRRIAVFLDGCFWHACPEHGEIPIANRTYWEPKLARNRERDREAIARLANVGWLAIRIWEHEDVVVASSRVLDALAAAR
jgi:DNA mismatch endonuclease (patch repair protein)